jgi:hypothetical protein
VKPFQIFFVGIFLYSLDAYSQEEPAIQFEGTARFDLIGVHNYDDKKYALFHGETDIAA